MSGHEPLMMARLGLALLERLGVDVAEVAGPADAPVAGAGRVLLVSSAREGEGKSFIAELLAKTLRTQCGGAVALVDGRTLNGALAPVGAGLFQPSAVRRAVQALRGANTLTLLDGPPLAECGALAQEVDALLLVVDARATPRRRIERALAAARVDTNRFAGVVLNRREAALPRWLGAD